MNRWYVRDRFTRYSLLTIIIVVTASLLGGFLLDWRGFLEGVLASLAFSGITIVVGLFFVDRLIEHRQEQQWARVRLITYRGLAGHICDVVSQTFVKFMILEDGALDALWQMQEGRNEPKKEALVGFDHLADALRRLKEPRGNGPTLSDQAEDFYEEVKWELEQIQSVLTPRLLASATDHRLVEALMDFDHANRALYSAIVAHKEVVTQSAFSPVVDLVVAAEHVYGELLPHWSEAEQQSKLTSEPV